MISDVCEWYSWTFDYVRLKLTFEQFMLFYDCGAEKHYRVKRKRAKDPKRLKDLAKEIRSRYTKVGGRFI